MRNDANLLQFSWAFNSTNEKIGGEKAFRKHYSYVWCQSSDCKTQDVISYSNKLIVFWTLRIDTRSTIQSSKISNFRCASIIIISRMLENSVLIFLSLFSSYLCTDICGIGEWFSAVLLPYFKLMVDIMMRTSIMTMTSYSALTQKGNRTTIHRLYSFYFFPKQKNRSFYEAHNVIKYFDDHGGFWQV